MRIGCLFGKHQPLKLFGDQEHTMAMVYEKKVVKFYTCKHCGVLYYND